MVKHLRFNLHGHMIEYNMNNRAWRWSKWDYVEKDGEKIVVRQSGILQFKKIFRSVFEGGVEDVNAHNPEDLEKALKEKGVDFIFLYQGETVEEDRFKTVEDAKKFYKIDSYPQWELTEYWFGFDSKINSWAMYDAFTGALQFRPESIMAQHVRKPVSIPSQRHYTTRPGIYDTPPLEN